MAREKKRTDNDIAKEILAGIREEMTTHSNLGAHLLHLARVSPSIQRRVLDQLRGPVQKGRPKRSIPDSEVLLGVEGAAAMLAESRPPEAKKPTDLEAIRYWLETTNSRFQRPPGEKFNANRESGKAEIRRVRDAIVRARRNRKNTAEKA